MIVSLCVLLSAMYKYLVAILFKRSVSCRVEFSKLEDLNNAGIPTFSNPIATLHGIDCFNFYLEQSPRPHHNFGVTNEK